VALGAIRRAPRVVPDVDRAVSLLESEGISIVMVEQNIELTLEPVDDIVILNSGSVVLRGAARDFEMNGAIVTQHLGVH
jgi:branched-chain amino acid transport system ATP-binding protein